jgi:hypothetical protein
MTWQDGFEAAWKLWPKRRKTPPQRLARAQRAYITGIWEKNRGIEFEIAVDAYAEWWRSKNFDDGLWLFETFISSGRWEDFVPERLRGGPPAAPEPRELTAIEEQLFTIACAQPRAQA